LFFEFQIDSNASSAYIASMSTTLTIRNLNEEVKQKLRLRAASHQTSMEAEAREILTRAMNEPEALAPPRNAEELKERLQAVRGIWKDRAGGRSTDEIMQELRGDD
jgi:plasmid stability protein